MSEPSTWRFNKQIHSKYVHELPLPEDEILVEYVFIAENGQDTRSKCRKFNFVPKTCDDLPVWNFGANYPIEDRFIKPVALYNDPFRRGQHKLALCEVYANDWTPSPRNFRHSCEKTMATREAVESQPWFGLEQEYFIVDTSNRPLGWPHHHMPEPNGPIHHDAVGMNRSFGRDMYEAHLFACMYAGVNISGGNAEACPGMWEFQVGPTVGVKAADDLWIARYIIHRLSEEFGYSVSFHPKLIPGEISASGGHVNFSTKPMREEGGMEHIKTAMPKLKKTHQQFLPLCDANGGKDNEARLVGYYCTAPKHFTWGVENRDATVRIPRQVDTDGRGFLEDRRPASNFDPYLVTDALVKVVVLDIDELTNPYIEPIVVKLASDLAKTTIEGL